MLEFVVIDVGGGTLSCAACGTPAAAPSTPFDALALRLAAAGANVAFRGDPLAHPRLSDLLRTAAGAGASRLRLEGVLHGLAEPDRAREALEAGVRHIRPFVLAGPEGHDAACASPGSFDAVRAAVASFVSAAEEVAATVLVTAEVPVCVHNLQQAPEAVAAAAAFGARGVALVVSPGVAASRGAAPWLAAACDTGSMSAAWVSLVGVAEADAPAGYEAHALYADRTPSR